MPELLAVAVARPNALTRKKQKARFAAGLQGEKVLWPMRGWPSNPILETSLVSAFRGVKREARISSRPISLVISAEYPQSDPVGEVFIHRRNRAAGGAIAVKVV